MMMMMITNHDDYDDGDDDYDGYCDVYSDDSWFANAARREHGCECWRGRERDRICMRTPTKVATKLPNTKCKWMMTMMMMRMMMSHDDDDDDADDDDDESS
eukprot:9864622-Karenia_brevis.AAC.1